MRRVIVLRPEPGASATVERARACGLDAIALPLFAIEPVPWALPQGQAFDAVLLTSANAVRFAGEQIRELRGLPVYAVGAATAEAARDAGFDIVATGDAGLERLLQSIEPDLKLLHLAGQDRTEAADARQAITPVTVYRAIAREDVDLTEAARSVVLVHSPRGGRRFAELAASAGLDKSSIAIAAISDAAADAAGGGWANVAAADAPSDAALLALAERLCNNMRRT